MLDLRFIRANTDKIKDMLQKRGYELDISRFEELDKERREIITEIEALRSKRNEINHQISEKRKKGEDASLLIEEMKEISLRIKEKEKELPDIIKKFEDMLLIIPNMPHESVPVGKDEDDNQVVRYWGERPEMSFTPLPHWEIGERLGILDFKRAARLAGSRFAIYKGAGARLERALINFMLNIHTREHGYTEVLPPFMVNSGCMTGTGQLPKFKEDLFKVEDWDLYLIPTAEVPVTNIHREEILDESELPKYYVAYTPCFRSEA
ncbi:MAG: serine--tRNA ligase, partial [Deltaproteobacteria bacterium]